MSTKPRVRIYQDGRAQFMTDSLTNIATGLGAANSKVSRNTYTIRVSQHELDAAYLSSTWFGKIVDIPADDATREWRSWQAKKEQIQLIEATEKRLHVRQKVRQALIWSRLYGGAVIVVGGLPGSNGSELNLNSISQDGIQFLTVLNRHEIYPVGKITDPMSPFYGQPESYQIGQQGAGTGRVEIHPSRVILFNGRKANRTNIAGEIWGESVWLHLADSIMAADAGAAVIHALLHETKVDVIRQPNLMEDLGSEEMSSLLLRRYQMAAVLKSLSNMLILDKEDEWDQKQINWSGLPEVMRTLLTIMSGAADIPVTRLTGEQQSGLSGADSGSIRNYYDSVKAKQELDLGPALEPLDQMLVRSALGTYDPEIWYKWNPLWQPTEKERAEVDKAEAEAVEIYARTGLIPEDALATMLQNRLIESAAWPGADTAYEVSRAALNVDPVEDPDEDQPGGTNEGNQSEEEED